MLKPSMHVTTVRQDRAILLDALVKGYKVDLGRIIQDSILEYVKGNFIRNIPHLSLITLLCIKGGVRLNDKEKEERCPKTSPLTLTRGLKALVESEEREGRKKPIRKRMAKTEAERAREIEELRGASPVRDQTPIATSNEGESNEEMGGFEANIEQPVLPPIANHGVPAQIRVEERR